MHRGVATLPGQWQSPDRELGEGDSHALARACVLGVGSVSTTLGSLVASCRSLLRTGALRGWAKAQLGLRPGDSTQACETHLRSLYNWALLL